MFGVFITKNYACIEEQGPISIRTSLGSAALEPPKQGKELGVLYAYRVFPVSAPQYDFSLFHLILFSVFCFVHGNSIQDPIPYLKRLSISTLLSSSLPHQTGKPPYRNHASTLTLTPSCPGKFKIITWLSARSASPLKKLSARHSDVHAHLV